MNIVIQIVGSRGDVQPFVALGLELKRSFGHRVRIATHAVFKDFVEKHELEFFNIGGNPEELMAFMVRNPGLFPNYEALRSGDVKQQRMNMYTILKGCWRACIEPGDGMAESPVHSPSNTRERQAKPFIADTIIANPVSFAHIHCAERLGIPLHLMFTMPYSPTEMFPHPLAHIRKSDLAVGTTNRLSYSLIERLIWHGLGDLINKFREEKLGLAPLNLMWATGIITRLKIPYTYCWSPVLLPKPKDWASHISVSGFLFLPHDDDYKASSDLLEFLEAGDPPVYIGFGSIVVDDPQAATSMIFEAIRQAGVRAVVSKGWVGIGNASMELPKDVFLLDNIPHAWLFERVSVVVHHGGAGTTAEGLRSGKPSVIVPFFGDQHFWGDMVASAGAGPHPVPYREQTAETLAQQIKEALHPEMRIRARQIKMRLQQELGCENAVRSFHDSLEGKHSRCSILPDKIATWKVKSTQGLGSRLSTLAAAILLQRGLIHVKGISIYRHQEYHIEDRPVDPITGGAIAFLGSFSDVAYETFALPVRIIKGAVIGTTKVVKKLDSSNSSRTMDAVLEREGSASQEAAVAPIQTQDHRRDDEALESWEDILNESIEGVVKTGKGVGRLTKAYLSSPLYFSLGLAQGFQSIPLAYGDTMTREREKVRGVASGVRVGSKELAYGFYDGITGLVTQPIRGAQERGVIGAIAGIGKGVGGLVLKPGAGLFGLPAYSLQGISVGLHKLFAADHDRYIQDNRLAQGMNELSSCSEEQQEEITRAWTAICSSDNALLHDGI
ncbi:glycosyltransferase family 1 protein [Stipitochalara longipes BDJ]|nr:glycosyltransferase family 1 protein [Stipitochalara longipes BDJ]